MKRLFVALCLLTFSVAWGTIMPDRPKDSRGMLKWEFDSVNQSNTDPTAGKMKFNAALPLLENSNELYIDDLTSSIVSADSILSRITTGDFLYVQAEYDQRKNILFRITAATVDSTGWFRLSVEAHSVGTAVIADGDTLICQLFLYDDSGGGGGPDDTTAKYLSIDFGTAEWVAYSPTLNAFVPWTTNTVDVGQAASSFRRGLFQFLIGSDSVQTPVVTGSERTLGIWFWKGIFGTDSLMLGVDTVNRWILACDGQGTCIPLVRDSLLGPTSDSVFKYMDADGGALSTSYARLLDSTTRDLLLLVANSPRFKLVSDSTLEVAGRVVTMLGDSTWGIGYIDFKSHIRFSFLDTSASPDTLIWYQLSDTLNGPMGNNWALTVDSAQGRLKFEAQVGGGGGSGVFADTALYVVDSHGGALVGKWVSGKWEWKNEAGGAQMITLGSTTDNLAFSGKDTTILGDTTFATGTTDIMGMLRFRLLNAGTAPDSIFWYRWVDSMANLLGQGWVPTIDSANQRIVWAAPSGGGQTDTLGEGNPNDAENFGMVNDSLGTHKQVRQLREGTGITLAYAGDTALTVTSTGGGETDTLLPGAPNGTTNFGMVRDSLGTLKMVRQIEEGLGIAISYGGDTSAIIAATLGTSVDLASAEVTGTLPVENGGTEATTFTDGGVMLGNGTASLQVTAVLTEGQLLIGDGTTDPAVAAMSGDGSIASTGALTVNDNSHNHGTSTVSGLDSTDVTNGGLDETDLALGLWYNVIEWRGEYGGSDSEWVSYPFCKADTSWAVMDSSMFVANDKRFSVCAIFDVPPGVNAIDSIHVTYQTSSTDSAISNLDSLVVYDQAYSANVPAHRTSYAFNDQSNTALTAIDNGTDVATVEFGEQCFLKLWGHADANGWFRANVYIRFKY